MELKGVRQGCILSPCFFNFYAEYTMRHTGLEEAQAAIKIAGRNINNLRYADTNLTAAFEKGACIVPSHTFEKEGNTVNTFNITHLE